MINCHINENVSLCIYMLHKFFIKKSIVSLLPESSSDFSHIYVVHKKKQTIKHSPVVQILQLDL